MFNEITGFHFFVCFLLWGFPGGSESKESAYNAGGLGSVPGLTRSSEEGGSSASQTRVRNQLNIWIKAMKLFQRIAMG